MDKAISLSRVGMDGNREYMATDLWTLEKRKVSNTFTVRLEGAQSKIFRLDP